MRINQYITSFIFIVLINSCATYKPQYKDVDYSSTFPNDKEILHSFYLIGDGGNSPIGTQTDALKNFKIELSRASKHSTALFLGDNIYPAGLPKKGHEQREFAIHQMQVQTQAVKDFKGETIFIPGNHDWYSDGLKGLKRQENFVEKELGKNTFLPENGCPIEKIDINDDLVLVIVDSQWYLENWDKHPTINDDCEIKTRTVFFDEYESLIKKSRGKTTIVAIHHPMFTNGSHGGQYSIKQQLFPTDSKIPIPVLGSVANLIRKTGGVTNTDIQNKKYRELQKRLVTLSQENDKVVFVSGHDHNLQYIVEDNLPQIISGSGSKLNPTRNVGNGHFSYATPGYSRLDVFKDGSSYVRFYSATDDKIVFETEVLSPDKSEGIADIDANFPDSKSASIYSDDETDKGSIYKFLWGDRYRKYYSTKVKATTANLDTLFGGLTPIRKGGGHQSKSLRLKDKEGREYVMRALRKDAIQYLQSVAFKDQYIEGQFNETYTEDLLLDMFTGSYPYAPFAIGTLADAVGIYHTNPVLYFIPKQHALGSFNNEFGNELYMIEERASSGHGDKESFGFSNKVISTIDMMRKLAKDEDYQLDEASYIRARLFDMLIGDWDRHEDQWRWARFKENDKTVYRPIPRDRDQAFSIMTDGLLLNIAIKLLPELRLMDSYEGELKSTKWFNLEPYPLDMALISKSDRKVWIEQADHIISNLTDDVIDEAFTYFPDEVKDETVQEIKQKLQGRRAKLQDITKRYFDFINKYAVIRGTNKDDWFDIERFPQGKTKVTAYRIKNGQKGEVFHEREYNQDETKEIWIYGLDDDDVYKVSGVGNKLIKVRLIGGQNKDVYNIENGSKIYAYDYKSKESKFITNKGKVKLTDDYETNVYDYKKLKNSTNQLIPTIGSNQDNGFKLGFTEIFTVFGLERNPFTSQHMISAQYYFATKGFDLTYNGEFAYVLGKWNLGLDAMFTSPNYSVNFFGYGNETVNFNYEDEDNYDLDYNRVKLSATKFAPSFIWEGDLDTKFKIGLMYEYVVVGETEDRFINTFYVANGEKSENSFAGIEAIYNFRNIDNVAFPTLGMDAKLQTGFKTNLDESKAFGYIIPSLGFNYKLVANGQLVLATKVKGHIIIGAEDSFEFYHGANIGGDNGLRGFRNQRFTGKSSFYQTTDVRLYLRKVKTRILPLNIGIYGGVDYGRVWINDNYSNKWNNSFGGGIFLIGADKITGNLSAFNCDEGVRIGFAVGFGF